MSLETAVETYKAKENPASQRDYIPFGVTHLETPKIPQYKKGAMYAFTSITFSTFKGIPLIDDSD